MAVNKNFVVKNGLEVNSNLLVADLDTQTVGIGTTIAPHELHVVGGIGVTNLNVTGVATIANLRLTGPSTFVGVTTFTDNVFVQKDLHVNGTINIDAGSGGSIGTDLHIQRHVRAGGIVTFSDSVFVGSGLGQSTGTSGQVLQVAGISSGAYIGGQVGIGTTNPAGGGAGDVALHVVGDSRFVGLTTFTGITTFQSDVSVQGSLKVTGDITYDEITGRNLNISGLATFQSLTQNRVAIVGAGDTLNDTNSLRFADNNLSQLVLGVGATVGGGLTVTGKTDLNSHVDVVGGIDADHVNTTGVSTFQGGSIDIANAIRHIGDPDTTIAFPSADTFKVETGGTDRLTIGPTGVATFSGELDINAAANISGDLTIADKVVHDGDTDTAIRFPANDTFTVETGGSERLRVTGIGSVGIGQTNPQGDLHIGNISGNKDLVMHSANQGNARIRFREGGSLTSGFNEYSFGMVGLNNALTVEGQGSGEIIRLMGDSGNIGINSTIPRAIVDFGPGTGNGALNQTISNYQSVFQAPSGTGNLSRNIGFAVTTTIAAAINAVDEGGSDATGLIVATGTSGEIAERVRVTSDGDIGIGTITPTGNYAVTASNEAVLAVGIATARKVFSDSLEVGAKQVISSARELQNIASLDSTTTATIESAIANAPNTFADIEVTGISTFKSTVKVEDLAPNRVVFVGAGDSLTDDANFTFDRSQLILGVGATVGGALTVADGIDVNTIRGATNNSNVAFGARALNGAHVISLTLKPDRTATFDGGVGIADSIFHIGDDNTQIRFPSADNFTVETGGSERLRIGPTGISTFTGDISLTAGGAERLNLAHVSGGDVLIKNPTDAYLAFGTNDTERLRIKNTGDVGIGTDTPTGRVQIDGTSGGRALTVNAPTNGTYITFETANVAYADIGSEAGVVGSGSTDLLVLNARSARDLAFRTNSNEALRITSAGDVEFKGNNGITSMSFDRSANSLNFVDNAIAKFGTDNDLQIYHDGSNSYIQEGGTGHLVIRGEDIFIANTANNKTAAGFDVDGSVDLYHNGTKKFETGSDGVIVTGIGTFDSNKHISIPVGTTAERSAQVANGMIRYNTTLNSYEGYGNGAWGGLGGGTEIDTTVSTTNPTGVGSFAAASYRSAMVRLQINQLNTDYQVGRYMLIHDGTTVTVLEEAAVSTGSTMVGSITGVIDGSNVELRVTLASAGVSTVTTIFDKITV